MRQPSVRDLASRVADRQVPTLGVEHRRAIIAAGESARLEDYRAALWLGLLHICGNCSRYSFGPDPAGPGTCAQHGGGLMAFRMPFACPDFQTSRSPTMPDYTPRLDYVSASKGSR
jgi:hypothetical protein